MNRIRFVKLQSVIFTPDFNLGNKLALINWFSKTAPEIFDGEVISVPTPQETPPDFPRIILQSKENNWNLNVSLSRTDLVFLSIPQDSLTIPLDKFIDISKVLFSEYKNKHDILIQRLALVTERVLVELDTAPAKFASERFCKEKFTQGPEKPGGEGSFFNTNSFEIHNLKKYCWESFYINSWVRVKATSLRGQKDQPVLLIENDINTQPEKVPSEGFSATDIDNFFRKLPREIDKILQLYFD